MNCVTDVETEVPLQVEGGLDIHHCVALRASFLERLTSGAPFLIDLASVENCDTAGLQLLCATHRSARAAGRDWRLINAPEILFKACEEAGMPTQDIGL